MSADVFAIKSQFVQCRYDCLKEGGVECFLIAAYYVPKLCRQGEDQMKVGDGQQLRLPLFQPPFGVGAMAFGTTAVLAGVIGVLKVAALLVALFQVSTHGLGAAGSDGKERPFVAVGHPVAEFLQILRAMLIDNLSQFDHGRNLFMLLLRLPWSLVVSLPVTWV